MYLYNSQMNIKNSMKFCYFPQRFRFKNVVVHVINRKGKGYVVRLRLGTPGLELCIITVTFIRKLLINLATLGCNLLIISHYLFFIMFFFLLCSPEVNLAILGYNLLTISRYLFF